MNIQEKLGKSGENTPANTALVLLCHVLKRSKSWVLAHTEYQLTKPEKEILQERLNNFLAGMPLPYLLGEWSFFGRSFIVTPDVLIPRPETELLVEKAIQHAKFLNVPTIVDVGTGSGIIAINLAAEIPSATITAVDISMKALAVAKQNAIRLEQTQIYFAVTDLLSPILGLFNLICANLPYIPSRRLEKLSVTKSEPYLALDGGPDGFSFISTLLEQSRSRLTVPGVILLEIESSLGEQALNLARESFPNAEIILHQDLAGHDRLIEIIQT